MQEVIPPQEEHGTRRTSKESPLRFLRMKHTQIEEEAIAL
jgi:hypothetical protein